MSVGETEHREIYEGILRTLRERGVETLARDIEQTVARGMVKAGSVGDPKAKSFGSLQDIQALAVALEHLIAAAEVPLMVEQAKAELGCGEVRWVPERQGTQESIPSDVIPRIDTSQLAGLLQKIAHLCDELQISLPEIA